MSRPAVFVFVQQGCGACHDYMPKFERGRQRHPNTVVGVYDLATGDARVQHLAETLGVRATPTTIVQTSDGRHIRHVGSLPVTQINDLFASAR